MVVSTNARIPFLVAAMLLTGVCNTLITKYQDNQCVRNCSDPDPSKHQNFEQPVWQTAQMFVGEMGSWFVIAVSAILARYGKEDTRGKYQALQSEAAEDGDVHGDPTGTVTAANPAVVEEHLGEEQAKEPRPMTGWRTLWLAAPAACDIVGTTLMNTGLLFVVASIYQMTRGTLVLFVGLFSVLFLHRSLSATKWFSLVIVVFGVGIVGLSGMIEQQAGPPHLPGDTEPHALSSAPHTLDLVRRSFVETDGNAAWITIFGMTLIFLAQTFTASQFVLEESIMKSSTVGPLQMVAFEGTFGLVLTVLCQVLIYAAYGSTESGRGGYFDMKAGWDDIIGHRSIWVSSLLIMMCVGAFNFFGLSVTKNVSATSRSTIDTCRVLFVWLTSLGLGWEHFRWLQVLGFVVLVYGTFLYNEIVRMPSWKSVQRGSNEEERRDD